MKVKSLDIYGQDKVKVKHCFIKENANITTIKGSQKVSNSTASIFASISDNGDVSLKNVTMIGTKFINCTTIKGEVDMKQMIDVENIFVNTYSGDISIDLSSNLFRGKYEISNKEGDVEVEDKDVSLPKDKGIIGNNPKMLGLISLTTIKGDVELEAK